MLSTEDVKKFIENSRQELEKEKKKLNVQNGSQCENVDEEEVLYSYNKDKGVNTECASAAAETNDNINISKREIELERRHLSATVPTTTSTACEAKNRSVKSVRRSVSTSPLRRRRHKDYSQELQIQIYPSDIEDDVATSTTGSTATTAGLLETVSSRNKINGSDGDVGRCGSSESLAARSTSDDIRKYCLNKLGGMLRTGEFSPNHPEMGLAGAARSRGDVFVGLGLYEERRRELMARRKREYREYLAKQKSLNALAKEKERLAMEKDNNYYDNQQQNWNRFQNYSSNDENNSIQKNNNPVMASEQNQFELNQNQNPNRYNQNQNLDQYSQNQNLYLGSNRQHLQSFLSPAGGWKGEDIRNARPRRPSSIAVQTEDDLLLLEQRQSNNYLTQAERELSPRPPYNNLVKKSSNQQSLQQVTQNPGGGGGGQNPNSDWRMLVEKVNIGTQNNLIMPPGQRDVPGKFLSPRGDYDEEREYFDSINGMNSKTLFGKDSPRARLLQDLRHTYMPSLFDEEAIQQRNIDIEKEAAAKRLSYQQELKQQIDEQHRLREERKAREKLLEEAETRRLEEQLKLLKLAHEAEMEKQKQMAIRIKKDSSELERQRLKLQQDIEKEKKALHQSKMKRNNRDDDDDINETEGVPLRNMNRSESAQLFGNQDRNIEKHSNLPFYYSSPANVEEIPDVDNDIMSYNLRQNNRHLGQDPPPKRVPFSTNIPDFTTFTESIPVKNYNTNDVEFIPNYSPVQKDSGKLVYAENTLPKKSKYDTSKNQPQTKVVISRNNWTNRSNNQSKPGYEPSFLNKSITEMIDTRNLVKNNVNKNCDVYEDSLPIPILKEPERDKLNNEVVTDDSSSKYSDAMRNVEDKWKVPAVQRNILKNTYTEDGKQENILTQLGSIRRQLQLEQLKLDQSQMLPARMVK